MLELTIPEILILTALAITFFTIVMIAYKILRIAIRTFLMGTVSAGLYLTLTYFNYLEFSVILLGGFTILGAGGYILYKILKIPLYIINKIRGLSKRET